MRKEKKVRRSERARDDGIQDSGVGSDDGGVSGSEKFFSWAKKKSCGDLEVSCGLHFTFISGVLIAGVPMAFCAQRRSRGQRKDELWFLHLRYKYIPRYPFK